jgi:lipoyl-dependent peroxiredoxin
MPTRRARAIWEGGRAGSGSFSGESQSIGGKYSFGSRFEQNGPPGTNPEELLAAAEASCFSMALTGALERNGTPATKIETGAACSVEKVGEGYTVTKMDLNVRASVPNIDDASFQKIVQSTKDGCPVSRALKGNVQISVDAKLE